MTDVGKTPDELADLAFGGQAEVGAGAGPRARTSEELADLAFGPSDPGGGTTESLRISHRRKPTPEYNEALRISNTLGVGLPDVETNIQAFRAVVESQEFNPQTWQRENPELASLVKDKPTAGRLIMADEKINPITQAYRAIRRLDEKVPFGPLDQIEGVLGPLSVFFPVIVDPAQENVEKMRAIVSGEVKVPTAEELFEKRKQTFQKNERLERAGFVERAQNVASREFTRMKLNHLGSQAVYRDFMASGGDPASVRRARELHQEISEIEEELGPEPFFETNPVEQLGLDITQAGMSAMTGLLGGGAGTLLGMGAGAIVGRGNPAATATGGRIGGMLGAGGVTADQEVGAAYLEFLKQKDDSGRAIDPAIARGAALVYGVASSLVESLQFSKIQKWSGFETAIRKGSGREWLKRAMTDPSKTALFKDLAEHFGKGALSEGAEEMTQETLNWLIGYGAQTISAGAAQEFDGDALVERAIEAGYMGTLGGVGPGSVVASSRLARHGLERRRAQRSGREVSAATQASESDTAGAVPEMVAELVRRESEAAGNPVESLYVDPVRLQEALDSPGVDTERALSDLLGEDGPARFQAAMQLRVDDPAGRKTLEVPLTEYMSRWGNTEVARVLDGDMTTHPEALSVREMAERESQDANGIQTRAQEIANEIREGWEPETQNEQQYFNALQQQLDVSNIPEDQAAEHIAVDRAVLETMARRVGIDLDEMYRRRAETLSIEPTTPRLLDEYFSQLTDQQRREAWLLDSNTRLRNFRGLQLAERDPERPMLAVFDVEGGKLINDHHGHLAFDGVLRKLGGVMRQHAPDGAKVGGSLAARVKDAAQARAIAQEMEQALGGRLRVLTTARVEGEDAQVSLEHVFNDLKKEKDAEFNTMNARGVRSLGHRKGIPTAFMRPDDPAIDFDAEPDKKPRKGMLHPKSKRAQAVMARAAEEVRPLAEAGLATPLTDASLDFTGPEADAFDQRGYEGVLGDVFIEESTGLLTGAGFDRIQKIRPREFSASADLRAFRQINDAFGRDVGDMIMQIVGETMSELGGARLDVAHLHGDEYAAQADSREELDAFFRAAKDVANSFVFYSVDEKGRFNTLDGVSLAHGIAEDFKTADEKALPAAKDAEPAPSRPDVRRRKDFRRAITDGIRGGSPKIPVSTEAIGQTAVPGEPGSSPLRDLVREAVRLRERGRDAVEQALSDPGSALSAAVAGAVALADHVYYSGLEAKPRTGGVDKAQAETKMDGWDHVLLASNVESPTEQADAMYRKWVTGGRRGPKPPPLSDQSVFDNLRNIEAVGDEPLSSVLEAYDKIVKGRQWSSIEEGVEALRDIEGLEGLRLPDEVIERKLREDVLIREEEFYLDRLEEERSRARDEDPDVAEGEDVDTSFDPETLEQPGRGWVSMFKDATRRSFQVFLDRDADVTTPIHELSHTYLEMLGDMAALDDTPASIRDDWQRALRYLGAEDRGSLTEGQKEQWAKAFEAYMLEGNPPSATLAKTFARLRSWFLRVYKSVASLGVELNDDIRGVFDRMLATDDEIAAMRRAMGVNLPFYRSAQEAGMTEGEYEALMKRRQERDAKAALRVQREVAQAQQQIFSEDWSREVRQNMDLAEAQYRQRRDVRAWLFLGRGELIDERGETTLNDRQMGKMDRDSVLRIMGRGSPVIKRLQGRLVGDGLSPEDMAREFGFDSGRELLGAITRVPDRRAWVRSQAEAITRESHPDLFLEGHRIAELARRALHEEGTTESLIEEMNHYYARGALPNVPSADVLRRAAGDIVGDSSARRISPVRYLNRERREAEKAVAAAASGDFGKAGQHKRNQLVAHYAWKEAEQARLDREKLQKSASSLAKTRARQRLGRAGKPFLDAADQILESMGLRRPPDNPQEVAGRTGILTAIPMIDKQQGYLGFDVGRLAMLVSTPPKDGWRGLTVGDMRVVLDALQQITATASDIDKIHQRGHEIELETLADAAEIELSAMRDRGDVAPEDLRRNPILRNRSGEKLQRNRLKVGSAIAELTEPEQVLFESGKTLYDAIWNEGYIPSRAKEDQLTERVTKRLVDMWEGMPKEVRRRLREPVPDRGPIKKPEDSVRALAHDRQEMIMIALNMGNEGNRNRLLDGYGWDGGAVDQWLQRQMTEEEWDFVQGIWDLMDQELYPEMARVHERVTGLRPERVQPSPVVTGSGRVLRGGYFPARYDPVASRVGEAQSEEQLRERYASKPGQITMSKSFTKERSRNFADVVNLDWGVVTSHVASVVHYVANEEFIRDTGKILNNRKIRENMIRHVGNEHVRQIDDWLRTVADFTHDSIPTSSAALSGFFRGMRSRFTASAIGFSATVAMADNVNFAMPLALGEFSTASLAKGAYEILSGRRNFYRKALDESPELQHRSERRKQEMRRFFEKMTKDPITAKNSRIMEAAFWMMDTQDKIQSAIIWSASMKQGMAGGMTRQEAVQNADRVVRRSLPSFNAAEQARILRDKRSFGAMVVFHSYFNKRFNQTRAHFRSMMQELEHDNAIDRPLTVAKYSGRFLATIVISGLVGEALSFRGPEENEELEEWILRKALSEPFMMFPLIGGFAEAGISSAITGDVQRFSVRGSPVFSLLQGLKFSFKDAFNEDGEISERMLAIIQILGLAVNNPILSSAQTRRTTEALIEGEPESVIQGPGRDQAGPIRTAERFIDELL